jgi:hypothetical protein
MNCRMMVCAGRHKVIGQVSVKLRPPDSCVLTCIPEGTRQRSLKCCLTGARFFHFTGTPTPC